MQIVINISDSLYDRLIKMNSDSDTCSFNESALVESIQNGTPLPKGHGNLKDVGKCDRKLFYQQCGGANSLINVKTAFDMLLSLPTIIEADNEVKK